MIKDYDVKNDGFITFDEFCLMMDYHELEREETSE
jgi:hypothetical protein